MLTIGIRNALNGQSVEPSPSPGIPDTSFATLSRSPVLSDLDHLLSAEEGPKLSNR